MLGGNVSREKVEAISSFILALLFFASLIIFVVLVFVGGWSSFKVQPFDVSPYVIALMIAIGIIFVSLSLITKASEGTEDEED